MRDDWKPQNQSERYFPTILFPSQSRTVVQPFVPLIHVLTSWTVLNNGFDLYREQKSCKLLLKFHRYKRRLTRAIGWIKSRDQAHHKPYPWWWITSFSSLWKQVCGLPLFFHLAFFKDRCLPVSYFFLWVGLPLSSDDKRGLSEIQWTYDHNYKTDFLFVKNYRVFDRVT